MCFGTEKKRGGGTGCLISVASCNIFPLFPSPFFHSHQGETNEGDEGSEQADSTLTQSKGKSMKEALTPAYRRALVPHTSL